MCLTSGLRMLTVGMSRVDPLKPHLKHITDRSAITWTFGSLAHSVSSGKGNACNLDYSKIQVGLF